METASPNERPRLPRYVGRGGESVWRQPSMLYGARIYGFGVKVDVLHQAEMLKRYVNNVAGRCGVNYGPAKFRLSPCDGVDMVMLMFVDYKRVASGTDDDSLLGGVSYREFLVTQLAFDDDPEFPEINWLIPFIESRPGLTTAGRTGNLRLSETTGSDPAVYALPGRRGRH